MKLMDRILETEDYVKTVPWERETFEYKLAYLIKEQIRQHKWTEGEKSRELSWDDARDEWFDAYYDNCVDFFKQSIPKRKNARRKLARDGSASVSKPMHIVI